MRLDEGDFKTIVNNPKYKALKQETVQNVVRDEERMVMLTGRGVAYLRDNWSLTVTKYGSKRKHHETLKENEKPGPSSGSIVNLAEINRFNDRILKLVNRFYTEPTRYTNYNNLYEFINICTGLNLASLNKILPTTQRRPVNWVTVGTENLLVHWIKI